MSNAKRSTAVGLVAVLAAVLGASRLATPKALAQSVQTYPIDCRGGPAMANEYSVDWHTDRLNLHFSKAPYASVYGLNPGQCAWRDRALNANETARLCRYGVGTSASFLYVRWQSPVVGSTPAVIGQWGFSSRVARLMTTDTQSTTNYLTFNVYNDGECLRVMDAD